MIELWQVALGLTIFAFGAWFEVERTYGSRAREMKSQTLAKTRTVIVGIYNTEHENVSEESLKKIVSMYDKCNLPTSTLDDTLRTALATGMLFLISLASRLAIDRLSLPELGPVEGICFFVGFVMLFFMIYNFHTLRKVVSSEIDPPSVPISMAILTAIIIGINLYMIAVLVPIINAGRAALDLIILTGLLVLGIIGALITLIAFRMHGKLRWAGYILFASPWVFLVVASLIEWLLPQWR
jgi:hypothetical protein